jgi:hypothetical protein
VEKRAQLRSKLDVRLPGIVIFAAGILAATMGSILSQYVSALHPVTAEVVIDVRGFLSIELGRATALLAFLVVFALGMTLATWVLTFWGQSVPRGGVLLATLTAALLGGGVMAVAVYWTSLQPTAVLAVILNAITMLCFGASYLAAWWFARAYHRLVEPPPISPAKR